VYPAGPEPMTITSCTVDVAVMRPFLLRCPLLAQALVGGIGSNTRLGPGVPPRPLTQITDE
jgi:hypothetical protein